MGGLRRGRLTPWENWSKPPRKGSGESTPRTLPGKVRRSALPGSSPARFGGMHSPDPPWKGSGECTPRLPPQVGRGGAYAGLSIFFFGFLNIKISFTSGFIIINIIKVFKIFVFRLRYHQTNNRSAYSFYYFPFFWFLFFLHRGLSS